jgi:hypothetical protein
MANVVGKIPLRLVATIGAGEAAPELFWQGPNLQ